MRPTDTYPLEEMSPAAVEELAKLDSENIALKSDLAKAEGRAAAYAAKLAEVVRYARARGLSLTDTDGPLGDPEWDWLWPEHG
jgi:hypothetical protein